jgi:purine-nucleoside phosphorylase
MLELTRQMTDASDYVQNKTNNYKPEVGLILGSGLGDLADEIEDQREVLYENIPHMKLSTVKGHAGRLVMGKLEGKRVMAFQGRIHYYEGYSMKDITFPVRIMQGMGVKYLFISNASGGIRDYMNPGDLMIIRDHINMMGDNPLIGPNDDEVGPRFPDMSNSYDRELLKIAEKSCEEIGIKPMHGVYCAVTGPNYETYAEIKFLQTIGTDAVGMSTVPEVLVAAHAGIRVVGISCITDVIRGPGVEVTHDEVLDVATQAKPRFMKLSRAIIRNIPSS